ncbi:MAG: hypothetical protein GX621_04405 [Pirellulaceae bacterium]|nr:hypothetical protein [Pirellulaceae bacterium]
MLMTGARISLVLLAITTALQQPGMAKEPSANPTDEAKAAKRPAKEVAAEMWERIRKVEADPSYKEFSTEYWLSINGKCHDAFRMVDQADDPTVVLEHFVDQFGKHGAEAKESGRKHSNARLRRPDSPFLEMDAKRTPSRGIMNYCW